MSSREAVKIEPVEKQISVALQPEAAFKLFTEGLGTWWPLATHSVGHESAVDCVFEGKAGGRIYEIIDDGREAEWGKVLVWEPFDEVVFTWYPSRTEETAQEVRVQFSAAPGGTLVELVHTGWETLGERAQDSRVGYVIGWDYVLANYLVAAAQ
jgi:uncharacterized protein YndB with AHSA1/START domain